MSDVSGPVLIFGRNGQVGAALESRLTDQPDVFTLARTDADFTNP